MVATLDRDQRPPWANNLLGPGQIPRCGHEIIGTSLADLGIQELPLRYDLTL